MSMKTIWYDETGRVKGVDDGQSKAELPDQNKASADTDVVGEITLDHVVTVEDGQVVSATFDPPPIPPEIRRARLINQLAQVADNKRRLEMVADRQEQIIAGTLKAFDITTRALKGLVAHTGYNPVAEGDITQAEVSFMNAVQNRAQTVGETLDAEEQIRSDIENDVITDPDTDLSTDPRWPA